MLPKTVRVFGIPYAIEKRDNLIVDGQEMDGFVTHHTAVIEIADGMQLEVEKRTLMHEVIHGMFKAQGHTNYRKDESLITALENGIVQILQDNPDLIRYITATTSE